MDSIGAEVFCFCALEIRYALLEGAIKNFALGARRQTESDCEIKRARQTGPRLALVAD